MDPAQGSEGTTARQVVVSGFWWKRSPYAPLSPEPLQDGLAEPDCLVLDLDIKQNLAYSYADKRRYELTLRRKKESEEEEKEASQPEEGVLFGALVDTSREEGEDAYEIVDFPVRHLFLGEGQITRPLMMQAVKRHVVTLGLYWDDATLHLPKLLQDLPASAPLRHVAIQCHSFLPSFSQAELEPLIQALERSPRVVGLYLYDLTGLSLDILASMHRADDGPPLHRSEHETMLSRLCRSVTHLAVVSDGSATFVRPLLQEVFSSNSKVKQLQLWLPMSSSINVFDQVKPSPSSVSSIDDCKPPTTLLRITEPHDSFKQSVSNFSLTRVDFQTLPPIKLVASMKSLVDVGLCISNPDQMRQLLSSGLHTRILTLRLCLKSPSLQIHKLILQGLESQDCTVQFLSCWYFFEGMEYRLFTMSSTDVLLDMFSLLAGVSSPLRLTALRLQSYNTVVDTDLITASCKYLGAPAARNLLYFDLRLSANGISDLQTAAEWELANSLNNNFTLCHLGFHWNNRAAETVAISLLRRNKFYRAGNLFTDELVKPDLAKLFVCGHPEVGKTSLSRALLSLQDKSHGLIPSIPSALKRCFLQCRPLLTSDPDRTRGMEMHSLTFKGLQNKLMIYDLAGQEEYHVFHHYFMNATNNDLFIVVCKYDNSTASDDFQKQLQYWLRFIVSHKSGRTSKRFTDFYVNGTEFKPRVIVVVNFFEQAVSNETITNITQSWTSILMRRFSSVVDFDEHLRDNSLFWVNANTGLGVQRLYERLKNLVGDFNNSAWPVPQLCYDISKLFTKEQDRRSRFHINRLARGSDTSLLLTTFSEVHKAVNSNATVKSIQIQAALQELHAQGYVIYFPSENTSNDHGSSSRMTSILATEGSTKSELVIIDTNWFSNKLIGSLLGTHMGPDRTGEFKWNKDDIRQLLRKQGCHERYLEEILRYLLELELCVALGNAPAADEEHHLLFPALVKAKEIVYPNKSRESSTKFFGRRLKCRDQSTHLIPFAIFTRLQVKLYRAYSVNNNSLSIGYGWISFMCGRVGVVVRFGGDVITEAWESKQCVDILTFCPPDPYLETLEGPQTRPMDDPRYLDANRVFNEIQDHFSITCRGGGPGGIPTVEMEEMVLQNADASSDASSLAAVLDKARTQGLLESHQEWRSRESTPVLDLLLPAEIREVVEGKLRALQSIEEEFCVISGEEGDGNSVQLEQNVDTDESRDAIFDRPLTGEALMIERKLNVLYEDVRGLHSKVGKIDQSLQAIKLDIRKLRDVIRQEAEGIIAKCSTRLLRNELRKDRAYPLYPYLVDVEGKLAAMGEAVLGRKKVRVHFLCEARKAGLGPHPVEGQKGREVTVEWAPWVIKAARVMVPAVKILCCLARVAAAVQLPIAVALIPKPEDLNVLLSGLGIFKAALQGVVLPGAIKALLQGVPDADWKELKNCRPGEGEVQEVVAAILGNTQDVDMERDFGLKRVISNEDDRCYWVCERHSRGLPEAIAVHNPFT